MELCPCASGKDFKRCCGRFIYPSSDVKGHAVPAKTPEQLMRSRYTAYALGGYGEYLLETWWPESAGHLNAAELSLKSCEWLGLKVLAKEQKGNDGWVTFEATYTEPTSAKEGAVHVLKEKSRFKRLDGRWFYVDGEVSWGEESAQF